MAIFWFHNEFFFPFAMYSVGPALKLLISLNPPFFLFFFFCYTDINSPKMKIFSLLILLSLSTIAIVSPLLAADSTSLFDLTNFHQLDPVSNVETDYFDNYPGMVEQTQPLIPGISTSQGTAGLPIKDSSLDAARCSSITTVISLQFRRSWLQFRTC